MNKLSQIWERAVKFMDNNTDKNLMHASKAQAIYDRVREQTGYDVTCEYSRWASHRTNVGLALPPTEKIGWIHRWHAEARFVEAMKDIAGIEITKDDIIHYDELDLIPSPLSQNTPS